MARLPAVLRGLSTGQEGGSMKPFTIPTTVGTFVQQQAVELATLRRVPEH